MARAFVESKGLASPERAILAIDERLVPGLLGRPEVRVRVYRAPADRRPTGCLLYLHGGGFIAGDLDTEDGRCVHLALGSGCVVVSVDYRLAPEHPFPAPVEDCYAALGWVTSVADELGVDRALVGVGGGSAGGNLAAAVALMARDRGGPAVAFQLLIYPALDDRCISASASFVGTPIVDGSALRKTWGYYLGDNPGPVSPYAAPARAEDLGGLPPAYVMTAELDPLRDEGIEYAVRLLAAGVSVELHQFPGAFHAFDTMSSRISRRALQEQVEWLRMITDPDDDAAE
jgi:acetyl esterase/lipase